MFGLVIEDSCFNDSFDAIVGMAYKEFAEPNVVPFFDSLMDSGIMGKNVFAFHMSMNPDHEESELMLGAWDDSRYSGDLVWHPVEHKLFWSIALDDVQVNGRSLGLCGPGKNCLITPDSGTSLITMPNWAHRQFARDYQRKACEKGGEYEYGELTFVINGVDYSLPSHHWISRGIERDGSGSCSTSIGVLDVGQKGLDDLFIAGDMFMQLFYTVFDRDRDMVGLAPAVHTALEQVNHWDQRGQMAYTDEIE